MRFPQLLRPDNPHLLLSAPCQDNADSATVDDTSNYNKNPNFVTYWSSDYATADGPGRLLPGAFSGTSLASNPDRIDLPVVTPQGYPYFFPGQGLLAANAYTIQWFGKRDSTAPYDLILCGFTEGPLIGYTSGEHSIYFNSDGANALSVYSKTRTTDWNHIALVLQTGGDVDVYANGELVGSMGDARLSDIFSLTNITDGDSYFFTGLFCGIKIYDEARSALQIAVDAAEGGIGPGNLVLRLDMQDTGATTVVNDTSIFDTDCGLNLLNGEDVTVTGGPGNNFMRAFDGAPFVSIGDSIGLPTRLTIIDSEQYTFECFFKLNSTAVQSNALTWEGDGDQGIYLNVASSKFQVAAFGATASDILTADTRWHHLAVILYDDGSMGGYIDGKYELVFDGGRSPSVNIDNILHTITGTLNGIFCGCKIYNMVRSQKQIGDDAKEGAVGRICPSSLSLLGVG